MKKRTRRPIQRRILAGEILERRQLLATFVWDGGGSDSNWSTAANWVGDVVPTLSASLVFPVGAARSVNTNDLNPGTLFEAILFEGDDYSIAGNEIVLDGPVVSQGQNNAFGLPVSLNRSTGFSALNHPFVVSGSISTNGSELILETSSVLTASGSISGGGGVRTLGAGTVALSGDNSYTGITNVQGSVLAVRHDNALGAANGMAAQGTVISADYATIRLDGGVTVDNEALVSGNVGSGLASSGSGLVNRWTGNLDFTSAAALNSLGTSSLIIDGDLQAGNLELYGSKVVINGNVSVVNWINSRGYGSKFNGNVNSAHLALWGETEINGIFNLSNGLLNADSGVIRGAGTLLLVPNPISVKYKPGNISSTAVFTVKSPVLAGLQARLNGTSAGGGYDQLRVIGTAEISGALQLSLGYTPAPWDSFVLIDNDGTDAVVGTFSGLLEGSLVSIDSVFFEITYAGGDGNDVVLNPLYVKPTLDEIPNLVINEDAPQQVVTLSGISAGQGESQPLRVFSTSNNTSIIPAPTVDYSSPSTSGILRFTPHSNQSGTVMITLTVEDGGPDGDLNTAQDNATFRRTFTVTVNPVNDAPTAITPASFAVDERTNTTSGYLLGTLNAADVDISDQHTFTIIGGPDQALFSVAGTRGEQLRLADGVLRLSKPLYQVLVRVTDSAGATYDQLLTVNVRDLLDVSQTIINGGAAQRSSVHQILVRFDGLVNHNSAALHVNRLGSTGVSVGLAITWTDQATQTEALIRFTSSTRTQVASPVHSKSLVDGEYELLINRNAITRKFTGELLSADYRFGGETRAIDNFYALYGEAAGAGVNGQINNSDYILFRQAFGTNSLTFDFDGNGTVNNTDFIRFRQNFGERRF